MYIQYLTEVILPSVKNSVGICKNITILIFYYILDWLSFLNSFMSL